MGRSRAQLGASALEHYALNGWVVVPGFFSGARTGQLVRFTDEVCELPEVAGKQMVYREPSLLDAQSRVFQRVENFCSYHRGFDQLIRGGRLESAVEQLLGGQAVLFKEKINFKMSGGAGFEPLLFMVPAGLGVQEVGLVAVGHVLGIGSDVALALSLAKRMTRIVFGVPALLAWQWTETQEGLKRFRRRSDKYDDPPSG